MRISGWPTSTCKYKDTSEIKRNTFDTSPIETDFLPFLSYIRAEMERAIFLEAWSHGPQVSSSRDPSDRQGHAPRGREAAAHVIRGMFLRAGRSLVWRLPPLLLPLQLSSGVLMTPLMAAWAAAFCFLSSSMVFLNSFSSES